MSTGPRPIDLSTTEGMALAALIVPGPADGEVRPEALQVFDAVRWLRTWQLVMGVQRGATGTYVRLLDHNGNWRTVFYRNGVWVAAARPASARVPETA